MLNLVMPGPKLIALRTAQLQAMEAEISAKAWE